MKNNALSQNRIHKNTEEAFKRAAKTEKVKNRNLVWVILFLFIVIICFVSPLFLRWSPTAVNLDNVLSKPCKEHLFGTDNLGRDLFARTLYGGKVSLSVSGIVTLFSILIGLLYGGISGYVGGKTDTIMMRFVEVMYSIPSTIIVLAFQMVFPKRILGLVIIMSLTSWMTTARVVRGRFMELKESNFIKTAISQNIPKYKIILGHMTRNTFSSLIVIATFTFANAIITETALSFLGVGIPIEIPSWGNMINNVQVYVLNGKWWVCFFPGLLIIISSLCVNFTGEYLKNKYAGTGTEIGY